MVALTKAAIREYWAFGAIVAMGVAGGAIWGTKISGDVDALKAGQARSEAAFEAYAIEQKAASRDVADQIRLLREAMIRAGTALDAKGG